MKEIELMLTGEMEMVHFIALLKTDSKLQAAVRNLIPADAINNKNSELWTRISFSACEQYSFDLHSLLVHTFKLDGSIGDNLNIFGTIQRVYSYSNPHIICTTKYGDIFDVYLSVVKDCFDGPEVRDFVHNIIQGSLAHKTKKKSVAQAKEAISEGFHLSVAKRPRWIQGAEWPMGRCSPMQFIEQKRYGEKVQYLFEDVDTHETKLVEQFY